MTTDTGDAFGHFTKFRNDRVLALGLTDATSKRGQRHGRNRFLRGFPLAVGLAA